MVDRLVGGVGCIGCGGFGGVGVDWFFCDI